MRPSDCKGDEGLFEDIPEVRFIVEADGKLVKYLTADPDRGECGDRGHSTRSRWDKGISSDPCSLVMHQWFAQPSPLVPRPGSSPPTTSISTSAEAPSSAAVLALTACPPSNRPNPCNVRFESGDDQLPISSS